MKKLICLLLILIMALSFVACGGNETPDGPDDDLPQEEIYPGLGGEGIETPIIPVS